MNDVFFSIFRNAYEQMYVGKVVNRKEEVESS